MATLNSRQNIDYEKIHKERDEQDALEELERVREIFWGHCSNFYRRYMDFMVFV